MVIQKLCIHDVDTSAWHLYDSIKEWWASLSAEGTANRKVKASITMLVSWVIWNERNARVFRHKCAPPHVLLNNVIEESNLWVKAEAKNLGSFLLRE